MATTIDALRLRRVLGRRIWQVPEPFGPDGWQLVHQTGQGSVIVTAANHDGMEWAHASMAYPTRLPTYLELTGLKRAVWGDAGWAMQVFAPASEHVNIHEHALHLWGLTSGARPACIPDFAELGSI